MAKPSIVFAHGIWADGSDQGRIDPTDFLTWTVETPALFGEAQHSVADFEAGHAVAKRGDNPGRQFARREG